MTAEDAHAGADASSPAASTAAWQDPRTAHGPDAPAPPEPGAAGVVRRDALPHIAYAPAHPAPGEEGWLAGSGRNRTRWAVGPQGEGPARALGLRRVRALIDSHLEPDAAVGLHHHDSVEVYYVLAGTLQVVHERDGTREEALLQAGDVHVIAPGEAHAARAGAAGARFLALEEAGEAAAAT